MPRPVFETRLLKRIEKLDKDALQSYVLALQQEKDYSQYLLNQLPIGILVLDEESRILWSNDTAQNILGTRIPKDRTALLQNILSDSEFRDWLGHEIHNGKGLFAEEKEILFPQHRFLIVTVRPLSPGETGGASCLVVLIDITSIRAKDREQSEIQRISSLVKLARGVAHELGNPLNSITIHLRLLNKACDHLSKSEKKKFQDTIGVLIHETSRLDQIIKNFLKATRQKPPEFKLGNILTPLENALKFLEPEIRGSRIQLTLDLARNLPQFLFDESKIYQAFLNLLKNAIEAMPKGGELRVKITAREKILSIAFQDTGRGIPEKDLPYIFEEYYTTKEEGSGLGLAIVYNIVREHGGRIEVKSAEKKGTLFVLYLPIRQEKLQLPMKTE